MPDMLKEPEDEIQRILSELEKRTKWGHPQFYRPLPPADSEKIRAYYASQLELPLEGDGRCLRNALGMGTIICRGYTRIVIGDYGAFVEFSEEQANYPCGFDLRWPGKPRRPVKYLWCQTRDPLKTKVYLQQRTVSYADYRVGFYYVDPKDCYWE